MEDLIAVFSIEHRPAHYVEFFTLSQLMQSFVLKTTMKRILDRIPLGIIFFICLRLWFICQINEQTPDSFSKWTG